MPHPPVLISNPENRRTAFFMDACRKAQLEAVCVSWSSLLERSGDAWNKVQAAPWIRIDSPGENPRVELALQALGATHTGAPSPSESEHGSIVGTHLWFTGFSNILREIQQRQRRFMTSPEAIIALFDKHASHQVLEAGGVPRPPYYGTITGWEDLKARASDADTKRVFAKLRYGSSASGVLAIRLSDSRVEAHTSVELDRSRDKPQLFNSLKVRRYRREQDVARIVDTLASQGMVLEGWVPKGSLGDKTCDLRVFCVAGHATHTVVRTSKSPMTNLHLGNARGSLDELVASRAGDLLKRIQTAAEAAQAAFSGVHTMGVDVAFAPAGSTVWVLEANAFGDLLPNLKDEHGRDTYTATLQSWQP